MDDKAMLAKLKSAYEKTTPNNIEEIRQKLEERNQGRIMEEPKKEIKKSPLFILKPVMATMMLVLCVFLGVDYYGNNYVADSVVSIDVNPSISLEINEAEKIIAATALNDDANKILQDINLEKVDLNTAVYAIIGSMLKNGYIDELKNSVLVTVQNDDVQKGEMLQTKLSNEIDNMLSTYKIDASIISQTLNSNDDTLQQKATDSAITLGKAKLVEEIINKHPLYSFDELVKLDIQELNLLATSANKTVDNVSITGEASEKAYIGKEKAKEIALGHANVKESDLQKFDIEFDYEDGIMIYDIDFDTRSVEYDYEVNATTGKVIKFNKEVDDDYVQAVNNDNNSSKTETNTQTTTNTNTTNTTKTNTTSTTKTNTTSKTNTTNNTKKNNTTSNTTTTKKSNIGEAKAKSTALNHAGVKASAAYDISIDYDYENGKGIYEVDFETKSYEYEYDIEATTGKVLHVEKEKNDRD